MNLTPIDPARKAEAEALFRKTHKTATEIAAETGLKQATLRKWCRQEVWRPPIAKTAPADWSAPRCAALARIDRAYGATRDDLASVLGLTRRRATALFSACGLPEAPDPAPPGPAILRTRLMAHIARQIAGFDAALKDAAGKDAPQTNANPALDSARVLRDLGGLKRLLDDLDASFRSEPDATRGEGTDGAGDADLPALRAQIAQRYAAFVGERPDAGLPGEPAAAPDPGARP